MNEMLFKKYKLLDSNYINQLQYIFSPKFINSKLKYIGMHIIYNARPKNAHVL